MSRFLVRFVVPLSVAIAGAAAVPASPVAARPSVAGVASRHLPLGPAGLAERRTSRMLQPGVTLTTIVRGHADPADFWTVQVSIPAGSASPDPDAAPTALSGRAAAERLAERLRRAGFAARVTAAATPRVADYAGGVLGYGVRVGHFADQSVADGVVARLVALGYSAGSVFTGWDANRSDRGPWRLSVLTIDPGPFTGALVASYGPNLEDRETTSALARARSATAAVNGGFFVLDPAAGAPGDPAGVGVYGGRLLSEPVDGRPALIVHRSARGTDVVRLHWSGWLAGRGTSARLDGIDRVPGLIRNCGGTADDSPTSHPLHDLTCTDPDELIVFTPQFGRRTPAGPGLEAVLDARGTVLRLRQRGGPLRAGQTAVQAIGRDVPLLRAAAAVGKPLHISSHLRDAAGRIVDPSGSTSIVNGGPELVRGGKQHATPRHDGMVHPGDPSFYYAWAAKRNPRTFAGVDRSGRTLLVTADGRSTDSLGLSLPETAAVAAALGMEQSVNLDGGGSTTMVVRGRVVNDPSDSTGERPVGDALLVLPAR